MDRDRPNHVYHLLKGPLWPKVEALGMVRCTVNVYSGKWILQRCGGKSGKEGCGTFLHKDRVTAGRFLHKGTQGRMVSIYSLATRDEESFAKIIQKSS